MDVRRNDCSALTLCNLCRIFIELSEQAVVLSRPRRVDGFLTEWTGAKSGLTVEEVREATLQVLNAASIPDNCWDMVDFGSFFLLVLLCDLL